jgi:hypothetical protein
MVAMVSEPKCISVLIAVPYMLHELHSAGYLVFMEMISRQLGSTVTSVIGVVVLGSLGCCFVYCAIVQRTIPTRMVLLIAALIRADYAAYCSTSARGYCVLEYDQTLDAFYALAEGTRPWLVLFKAGGAAFAVAAAGLSCGFRERVVTCGSSHHLAVLCLVTRCMPVAGTIGSRLCQLPCGMQHISARSSGLESHVTTQQLQAAPMMRPDEKAHSKSNSVAVNLSRSNNSYCQPQPMALVTLRG